MLYSTDRIQATHAGSLPRPDDLFGMVMAKAKGEDYDEAALQARLSDAVTEVVKKQVDCGIDSVNVFSGASYQFFSDSMSGNSMIRVRVLSIFPSRTSGLPLAPISFPPCFSVCSATSFPYSWTFS